MRWLSPPESERDERASERYPNPTSSRKRRRSRISFTISCAIFHSLALKYSSACDIHSAKSVMDMDDTSAMFFPPMRNCKASFFRRVPPQTLHGRYMRNCSRHFWPRFESSSSVVESTYSAMPSQGIMRRPETDENSDKSTVRGLGSPYRMAFIPSSDMELAGSSNVKS